MKKTMSINLNGLVFNLEEDAFEALKKYLDSIERYYVNTEEEKEIISDIEASIAEKFTEKVKSQKQAITLSDVETVVKIMGTVEEIADEETASETKEYKPAEKAMLSKRLYRDTDNAVIAGVASGLAAYFGIDPTLVRLVFIALIFANGFGIIAYIVFWVAMPKAETNAQKLEMRGRPVNLSEIENAVKEKSKAIGETGKKTLDRLKEKNTFMKIVNIPIIIIGALFELLKKIWKAVFPIASIGGGILALIGSVFGIIAASIVSTIMAFYVNSPYIISDLPLSELSQEPLYYVSVISFYIVIVLPMIFLTSLGITMIRRKNSFSLKSSSVLAGIWMLAVIIAVVSALSLAPMVKTKASENIARQTITRNYDYLDFSKLYLGSNLNLKIEKGDRYSIKLTGVESDLERLTFNIEDGQLQIGQNKRTENKICIFCNEREITGEITVPRLDSYVGIRSSEAELTGFSDDIYVSLGETARAKLALNGQNLNGTLSGINTRLNLFGTAKNIELKMDGSADLIASDITAKKMILDMSVFSRADLDGRVDDLKISAVDTTNVSAFDLEAGNIEINAKDFAQADLAPTNKLEATAEDSADVRYINNPNELDKRATGRSTIERYEDAYSASKTENKIYIRTDVKQYSPIMSSIRGIGLSPEYYGSQSYPVIFRFSTNQGYLIQDFDSGIYAQEFDVEESGQKIYWTYLPDEFKPKTGEPIYVYLQVRPKNEDKSIAETKIEFTIDDQGMVTQTVEK